MFSIRQPGEAGRGARIRSAGLALAVATVLLAIVATQWPFDYQLTRFGIARRWARVDWAWFHRTPKGDIHFDRDFALNLLMLLPLGVGYGIWRRAARLRVIGESLVLGILVSVTLELAQLTSRHRYTSLPDVWHNAVGCMVGCMLAITMHRIVRRADGRSMLGR